MPPGDTLILNSLDELPDSIRQIIDSLWGVDLYQQLYEENKPSYPAPEWIMFLFLFFIIALSAYLYIIRPASSIRREGKKILTESFASGANAFTQYDQWLSKYNPYYNSLTADMKTRFIRRTILFRESKEFRFHFMHPEAHIPVLISGAAVQLTFGLKRFQVEFFKVINVIKKEYSLKNDNKLLEGHVQVNNRSINISWNNFLGDYEDYSDSANLGLHEMAHTISFDFLYGNQENKNEAFLQRFRSYVSEARLVFKDLCLGKNDLLSSYGTINFEEFWAVAIEAFFENTLVFRDKLPGLYKAICEVLNQDPLQEEKIIDKSLAGLAI